MQKQMLWNSFQEKNKQLEMQHKMQLEHKFQVRILFERIQLSLSAFFVCVIISRNNSIRRPWLVMAKHLPGNACFHLSFVSAWFRLVWYELFTLHGQWIVAISILVISFCAYLYSDVIPSSFFFRFCVEFVCFSSRTHYGRASFVDIF